MVDWGNLAAGPCYPEAIDYTGFVGQLTGYLIKEMRLDKIHVIGFSLGAHIAAVAGQMNGGRVLRVTGNIFMKYTNLQQILIIEYSNFSMWFDVKKIPISFSAFTSHFKGGFKV